MHLAGFLRESNNHCNGCTYDSDGNVEGDGNYVYGWNVYSKVAWSATSGTPTCGTSGRCTVYDAFGRIVEWSNGSTWYERWITQVGETAYMSGTTTNYGFWPAPGGGKIVVSGTTNYNYMHLDWLRNARIVSNISSHAITHDQAYSPFGEMYDGYGASSAEYYNFAGLNGNFYSGVTWDAANRSMSNFAGRWLSTDPAGLGAVDPTNPQTWNRYAYVTNNPLAMIDPLGLQQQCIPGALNYENDCQPIQSAQNCQVGEMGVVIGGQVFCGPWWLQAWLPNLQCSPPLNCGQGGQTGGGAANNAANNGQKPTCVGARIVEGIQGVANVGLGELKTAGAVGVGLLGVAGAPETGGLSLGATVAAGYGVISSQGQLASGVGQLYSAISGNFSTGGQIQQVGDILSGPVTGVTTLVATGNTETAATYANFESYLTLGAGAVNSESVSETIANGVDAALSLMGVSELNCQ
jgi:RHS repeat-associated protein